MRVCNVATALAILFGLILMFGVPDRGFAQSEPSDLFSDPESRLLDAIDSIVEGRVREAQQLLEGLLQDQPTFRLANLLYADIISMQANRPSKLGVGEHNISAIQSLIEEAKRRYAHKIEETTRHQNMVPDTLIKVSPSQHRVVVVDSALSRAHVYENGIEGLQLVDDYYATIGKNGLDKITEGDSRTPMGVYFITSRLNPLGLDDLYGDGALPLNYPNEWDQRLGKTGYGIWLHGVPSSTYNRPPFATQGCIALPNTDISSLYNTSSIEDTPVLILPSTNWVSADELKPLRNTLLSRIEQWRTTWVARDMNIYEDAYSKSFSNGQLNYELWKQRNEKISSALSVALSDVSLFKYPGNSGLVVATFNLNYWGENEEISTRIRQYWQLESDNQWRIVYEGPAKYESIHFKGIPENVLPVVANQ